MDHKPGPDLPSHGVGVVAQERPDLEVLFEALEKNLNLPPATVKVGHTGRRPVQVIGDEFHDLFLSIDLHFGPHQTQPAGIGLLGVLMLEFDQAVPQDVLALDRRLFYHFIGHIVLGAADPKMARLKRQAKFFAPCPKANPG